MSRLKSACDFFRYGGFVTAETSRELVRWSVTAQDVFPWPARDERLWQKAMAIARVSAFSAREVYNAFAYHQSADRPDVTVDQFLAMASALQRLGYSPSASTMLWWLWRSGPAAP